MRSTKFSHAGMKSHLCGCGCVGHGGPACVSSIRSPLLIGLRLFPAQVASSMSACASPKGRVRPLRGHTHRSRPAIPVDRTCHSTMPSRQWCAAVRRLNQYVTVSRAGLRAAAILMCTTLPENTILGEGISPRKHVPQLRPRGNSGSGCYGKSRCIGCGFFTQ